MSKHRDIISRFNPNLIARTGLTQNQELLADLQLVLRPLPPQIDESLLMRFRRVASLLALRNGEEDEEQLCSEPPPAVPTKKMPNLEIAREVLDLGRKIKRIVYTAPKIFQVAGAVEALGNFGKRIQTVTPELGSTLLGVNQTLERAAADPIGVLLRASRVAHVTVDPVFNATDHVGNDALRDSSIANQRIEFAQIGTADAAISAIKNIGANALLSIKTATLNNVASGGSHLYLTTLQGLDLRQLSAAADPEHTRQRKLQEAAESREFRKVKPKVLFTSDHFTDGKQTGIIVGWKEVPRAAGYVINRIDVFTGKRQAFTVYNEELSTHYDAIRSFVESNILPFYGNRGDGVVAFHDREAPKHAYLLYNVVAFQTHFESRSGAFIVPTINFNSSPAQRKDIRAQLERLDPGSGPDTISPYPILAKVLLGDSKFDWLLAGINVRASVDRRDNRSVTRGYSYLNAQLDFLFQQMSRQSFAIPANVEHVISNIMSSLSAHGVVKTLQELLVETGILYYFEGVDPAEDGRFDSAGPTASSEGKFLSAISAALDPETYSLDLGSFVNNLIDVLGGGGEAASNALSSALSNARSAPAEIDVPSLDSVSFLEIRLRGDLGDIDGVHLDLATIDGISRLMRTIRVITDLGPSRGAQILGV